MEKKDIKLRYEKNREICEKLIENNLENIKAKKGGSNDNKYLEYNPKELAFALKKLNIYNPNKSVWKKIESFHFKKEKSSTPIKDGKNWDVRHKIHSKVRKMFCYAGYWPSSESIKKGYDYIKIFPNLLDEAYGKNEDEKIISGMLFTEWEKDKDMSAVADKYDYKGFDLSEEFINNIHDKLRIAKDRAPHTRCKTRLRIQGDSEKKLIEKQLEKMNYLNQEKEKTGTTNNPVNYLIKKRYNNDFQGVLFESAYSKACDNAKEALEKLNGKFDEIDLKTTHLYGELPPMLSKRSIEGVPALFIGYRDILVYLVGAQSLKKEFIKYSKLTRTLLEDTGYNEIKTQIKNDSNKKLRIERTPFEITFHGEIITD